MTVYRWLYKYSPHHQKGTVQIVQMSSEMEKTKQLQKQLAQTEQIVGQKQIYIDYLERMLAIASEELKVDIKKNFGTQRSNGSEKRVLLEPILTEWRERHPSMSLKKLYVKIRPNFIGRNGFIDYGMANGFEAIAYKKPVK